MRLFSSCHADTSRKIQKNILNVKSKRSMKTQDRNVNWKHESKTWTENVKPLILVFQALQRSKFRTKFRLSSKDAAYVESKGTTEIRIHARKFIVERLAPAQPPNDGKQTPYRGHPVFTAQHATATCCRTCLMKWHEIPKNIDLNDEQIDHAVAAIMEWIENQVGSNA